MNTSWIVRGFLTLILLLSSTITHASTAWDQYKQRFLQPDGRIIDDANRGVSHTEGQGFSMLLAVINDDPTTFERLWHWTDTTLYNPETGLYSWRYDPSNAVKISDKNNATDGDTLIAWALLEAGKKWQIPAYIKASETLQKALLKETVITYAGLTLSLPGSQGFKKNNELVILNPSYFIFPAWQAFYNHRKNKIWATLIQDGMHVLKKAQFGKYHLPTDWIDMQSKGIITPANGWPPRFSYDAIRIPLYVYWYQPDSPLLTSFQSFWHDEQRTDAWINVTNNELSEYPLSYGMQGIRSLILKQEFSCQLEADDSYYSSVLRLLACAAHDAHP